MSKSTISIGFMFNDSKKIIISKNEAVEGHFI